MSSNSVDIILNGKETVTGASNQAIGGLSKLNDALNGTQNKLRGFNSIMELAFGFHIGRFFFEKVRAGIVGIAEGFSEARKEGLGFNDAISDGIKKVLGLATAVEVLAKNRAALREGEEQFGKGINENDSAKRLAYLGAARDRFGAQLHTMQAAANPSDSILYNIARYSFLGWFMSDDGRGAAREAIPDIARRLGVANLEYQKAREFAENRHEALLSGRALINNGQTYLANAENWIGTGGAGIARSLLDAAWSPFSGLAGGFVRAVNAKIITQMAQDFGNTRERIEEELRVERLRLREGQLRLDRQLGTQVGTVGAENARFLTRGAGSLRSPELQEAQKTNANLEAIKDKIRDLETQLKTFNALGIVQKL